MELSWIDWFLIAIVSISSFAFLIFQATKQPEFKNFFKQKKEHMTTMELQSYDGVNNPKVFIALKGVIYDVTCMDQFGVKGSYHKFAGYDASINLAKMSHDDEFRNKYEEINLNNEQVQILDKWVGRISTKCPIMGQLIKYTPSLNQSANN